MSTINTNPLGATPSSGSTTAGGGFDQLSTQDFLEILIAQLSNQNPLEPTDNQEVLNQINSINQLQSNQLLVDSLESLSQNQSLGSASNMIGRSVTADIGGVEFTGVVDRAVIENGQVAVVVNDQTIPLEAITEIREAEPPAEEESV